MATVARKQANFDDINVEQLCRTWLAVSQDPKVGAQQKGDVFWHKIQEHYHNSLTGFRKKHPGVVAYVFRSLRSLDSKWGKVSHDCSKFSGAMAMIEIANPSCTTWEDRVELAKLYYKNHVDPKEKEFMYFSSWMILKDHPKWKIVCDAENRKKKTPKKRKKAGEALVAASGEDGAQETSEEDTVGERDVLGTPEPRHMIGTKKAKEIALAEAKQQRGRDTLAASTAQIAVAMNRMATAMEEAHELQLFSMDTSILSERARQFVEKKMQLAEANLNLKLQSTNVGSAANECMEDGSPQNCENLDSGQGVNGWEPSHYTNDNDRETQNEYGTLKHRNENEPDFDSHASPVEKEGEIRFQQDVLKFV